MTPASGGQNPSKSGEDPSKRKIRKPGSPRPRRVSARVSPGPASGVERRSASERRSLADRREPSPPELPDPWRPFEPPAADSLPELVFPTSEPGDLARKASARRARRNRVEVGVGAVALAMAGAGSVLARSPALLAITTFVLLAIAAYEVLEASLD